ncbi:MAG TPA: DUF4097 family beta strand repeat-containing protein [Ruminococcus sp.]
MSKTIKKWLITAASLTALGFIILIGAMAALDFDFSKISTLTYETNTYEVNGDFDKISIDVNITDIVFAQSDDESCQVVCFEAEKVKHSVRCTNGTLTIGVTDNRKWYDYFGISFASPKMTIYLPKSEYASLLIDTDTSDINIPKSFSFNELEIESDTGNVDCMANVSDSIKIESDTGDIDISSVSSKCDIDIKTDTGSIKLTDVDCTNFSAESDTGNISLVNVIAEDGIYVESDTGNVKLKNSDASKLSIETDTGDVTGTLLSEKIFIAKSSTGRVKVPDTESGGKCEIRTATGNIKIDIQ